jgi:hypothetical protein
MIFRATVCFLAILLIGGFSSALADALTLKLSGVEPMSRAWIVVTSGAEIQFLPAAITTETEHSVVSASYDGAWNVDRAVIGFTERGRMIVSPIERSTSSPIGALASADREVLLANQKQLLERQIQELRERVELAKAKLETTQRNGAREKEMR